MTYLTLNTQLRSETNAETIANLIRKGWQETTPPSYDPATQRAPEWVDGAWVVRDKTAQELAAETCKVWPTVAEFWAEFSEAEQIAIIDSDIPGIRLLDRQLLVWRGEVWSDDPRVQQGLGGLVAVGILTAERREEILQP
jgi:hypothetical protein